MKKKILLVAPVLALIPSLAAAEVNQPQEIINRPRTLPAGQLELGADLHIDAFGDGDLGLALGVPLVPDYGQGPGLSIGYGVNEKLEVRARYAMLLKEFEAKGSLDVSAAYSILDAGNLTAALDGGIGYTLLEPVDGLNPLTLGAEVQFKLSDKMAIFTPGHQLSIGLEDPQPINLTVPVGLGYQANEKIFVSMQTQALNLGLKDSDSSVILADPTPLSLQLRFSPSNTMDLGGGITFADITDGDSISEPLLNLSARLYM